MTPLAVRTHGEYGDIPGLRLTVRQAAPLQLEPVRHDIEASLPGLRACRRLVVVIPASLEEHLRIVDLVRDGETLPRLRRIHQAFGEALRNEQVSREIDSLDQ